MAQRHEVEAWVNPRAWDDEDEAERVITAIMDSGSDDEADWARIAFPEEDDPHQEAALQAASLAYDRVATLADETQDALYAAVRRSVEAGMTRYRAAQVSGLSQPTVAKIVKRSY